MFILQFLFHFIHRHFKSDAEKTLEIIALRSQLALYQCQVTDGKRPRPKITQRFRKLWVFLSGNFGDWASTLTVVKPKTVILWHRRMFKYYWRNKSRYGRPVASVEIIALIKRINKDNPTLSPEKIHERLVSMNICDAPAPNTIAKYIKYKRKPPTEKQKQSWQNFLRNHAKGIWAMDFATVTTLTFNVLHVLIIVSHERRRIVHVAVTEHPTTQWVIQQIRNATPFGIQPKYLLSDNGSVFTSKQFQNFLTSIGIKPKRITPRCPWQNGICERLVGIVRRELLDFVIPFNEKHLTNLLHEYVDYYNNVRTHQGIDCETPVLPEVPPMVTSAKDTILVGKPILGGLYHKYDKYCRGDAA